MSLGSWVPLKHHIFAKATRVLVRCSQGAIRGMGADQGQEAMTWGLQRGSLEEENGWHSSPGGKRRTRRTYKRR